MGCCMWGKFCAFGVRRGGRASGRSGHRVYTGSRVRKRIRDYRVFSIKFRDYRVYKFRVWGIGFRVWGV